MTDFETLKSTLKEEILNELKATTKTRKSKKTEEKTDAEFTPLEEKQVKPKRKCSEKQLAALAAGRQKNPRWIAKRIKEEEKKKQEEKKSE